MKYADIIFSVLISGLLVLFVVMLAYVLGETHAVSLIQNVKEAFDNL